MLGFRYLKLLCNICVAQVSLFFLAKSTVFFSSFGKEPCSVKTGLKESAKNIDSGPVLTNHSLECSLAYSLFFFFFFFLIFRGI